MLSTFLASHAWLPITLLIVAVVVGPVVGALLQRAPRVTLWLLIASVVAVLVLTCYPEARDPLPTGCEVSLPYLAPKAVESMANILLFVPSATLAALVAKRPWVALVGGIGLSAVIETAQMLLPVLGRSCDTGDLITNSIGAAIGAGIGWAALLIARRLAAHTAQAAQDNAPRGR